jgi:GAF domain-containing protein
MLARQHRLGVGKMGIVGFVTGAGQARIATDVGEDSVFFNNPDLQSTRSEMALPLKVGDEIIGALDVQSTESNAFTTDDIDLFSTLADQVAIAIYNNRLYSETAAALLEAQNLHRQYLRQEWSKDLVSRTTHGIQYTPQGLVAQEGYLTDLDPVFQTGEPTITSEEMPDHTFRSVMAVPIILRGESIGVIRIQDNLENRSWSDDEFTAVREVAQQVGVALEAARLLEQTIHRAEREKKVMEITGLIRATNDPQQMLEIAASELQKALGASRAQIFIRKPTRPLSSLPIGGNGHKNDNGHAADPGEELE